MKLTKQRFEGKMNILRQDCGIACCYLAPNGGKFNGYQELLRFDTNNDVECKTL